MKTAKGLAHIAIFTTDLQKSIAFYERLGGVLQARDAVQKPTGVNQLALLAWCGITLELIEPHDGTDVQPQAGAIPHFAIEVSDLAAAAQEVRNAGIDTFLTAEPKALPQLFGGLTNWFFTGPSGEQIELLQRL